MSPARLLSESSALFAHAARAGLVGMPGPATVLHIGPSTDLIGGMSAVIRQMLKLDFGRQFHLTQLTTTRSPSNDESRVSKMRRHVAQASRIREAVRVCGARIVHLHTCSGVSFYRSLIDLVTAKRCGCRTILHVHGAAFDEFHARANPLARRWIAWGLARADRVVALSDTWAQKLRRMSAAARVTVVANGVAVPPLPERHPSSGQLRLLFLARLDDWKGVDDLLDAMAILRRGFTEAELILAGPAGSAGNECTLAGKLDSRAIGPHVRWVGAVNEGDKEALFRECNVYVQPSWNEGMPIALLEAMARGMPVVATSVGAVPEIIRDGVEGLLVEPHVPAALAAAVERIRSEPFLGERLGTAARATIEAKFGLGRLQRDLETLYTDLLGRG